MCRREFDSPIPHTTQKPVLFELAFVLLKKVGRIERGRVGNREVPACVAVATMARRRPVEESRRSR